MSAVDRTNGLIRKVPTLVVYLGLLIPAAWLMYQAVIGGLGVDPVKALEHGFGEISLQLVILGLAITPMRRYVGLNLLKFRRAVGVITFVYVLLHLLVWLVLDVQIVSQIWADILKRPYVTVGMAAFLAMVPLAVTSNNWSVRKLGPRWRTLHKATYGIAILGGVHFLMLTKGFQLEPILYMAAILALLGLRMPILKKPAGRRVGV